MTGDGERERRQEFERRYGTPPEVVVRVPGRVNLIGDHTDYHEGFVLPMAIELETVVAATPRGDGRVRVRSLDEGTDVELPADGSAEPRSTQPSWGR